MGIILWIIFGAISGYVASVIMKTDNNQGTVSDIIMGIVGAVVGGFVLGLLGQSGVTGFNLYSFFVAIIGAMIVIFIGRKIRQ